MLLMFSAGFANLGWMVALTAAMTYEALGRHGQAWRLWLAGLLLAFAAFIVLTGSIPAFVGE